MSAFFVTSSGTGIGKTLVSCIIARQLGERGVKVRAVKPVLTGFTTDGAPASDSGRLLAALGEPVDGAGIAAISPWRFQAPLSPDMAAAREGRTLRLAEIAAFCRVQAEGDGVLLVEGIGGVMVPLTPEETVLDLMEQLRFPVILVVGSYLGTLSHTLTAAAALKARKIPVASVVVSCSEESPVPVGETADVLARFLKPAPVLALPRLGGAADRAPGAPDLAGALGPLPPA